MASTRGTVTSNKGSGIKLTRQLISKRALGNVRCMQYDICHIQRAKKHGMLATPIDRIAFASYVMQVPISKINKVTFRYNRRDRVVYIFIWTKCGR